MPRLAKRERDIRNKMAVKKIDILKKEIAEGNLIVGQKHPPGMIPRYSNPEEMGSIIKEYLDEKLSNNETFTIAGLAKKLQIDVETLRSYRKKDEYSGIMKNMVLTLLESYEKKMLSDPKSFNALKYYLENNFSGLYSSKTTTDVNVTWSISLLQLNREAEKIINAVVVDWEVVN